MISKLVQIINNWKLRRREPELVEQFFREYDKLFIQGNFEEANQRLEQIKIKYVPTPTLICYLGVTLPASDNLPYRTEFYKKVEEEIKQRGHFTPELLKGLERYAASIFEKYPNTGS